MGAHSRLGKVTIIQRWGNVLILKIDMAGPGHMTDPILQGHRTAFSLHVRRKDWPKALKEVLRSLEAKMWSRASSKPEKERIPITSYYAQEPGLPATVWRRCGLKEQTGREAPPSRIGRGGQAGEKEEAERSQTWKGQDYWKSKNTEVGAGNKLKLGAMGSHSRIQSREQDCSSHPRDTGEAGGQKREEHSGQRKLHVQRP